MEHKIYSFSISIAVSLVLLFCIAPPLAAQESYTKPVPKREQPRKVPFVNPDTIPFYKGMYVGVDLYGLGSHILGSDFISGEVRAIANLKNKFFPTIELGMGKTNTWGDDTGIHYKVSPTPYIRIGIDYNTMHKKKDQDNFVYVGLRYGFTSFKYDVTQASFYDPIWKEYIYNTEQKDDIWGGSIPYNHTGMKASMHWFELVFGVKTKIYKNFCMGWSLRMKYKISASIGNYGDPWYVPGYGKYQAHSVGLTYSLIYKLPF